MLVAAGVGGDEFGLARYEVDGQLDPLFGSAGKVSTAIASAVGDEARALAVQDDGMIVAAGSADDREMFAVVRYGTDGTPDPGFGTGGVVTADLTPGFDIVNGIGIQADGKIVVAGSVGTTRPKFAILRLDAEGDPDPTFGDDGVVITPYGIWGVARAMAIQPNGKIVLAGGNGGGWALARYTTEGELDPTFGDNGKATSSLYERVRPHASARRQDRCSRSIRLLPVRRRPIHATGRPDRTFSKDGRVTTDIGYGSEQIASAVAVQHDGRILVSGSVGPHESVEGIDWRFALIRYRANGVLDPAFGSGGRITTRFADGADAHGAAMAIGHLTVVGGSGPGNAASFALARYGV